MGAQFLPASLEGNALPSLGSIAVAIKAFFHPERALDINVIHSLHLGKETLQVEVKQGDIKVQHGESQKSDVVFHTSVQVFLGLFTGQMKPDEAISGGMVRIEGDPGALSRFLSLSCFSGSR